MRALGFGRLGATLVGPAMELRHLVPALATLGAVSVSFLGSQASAQSITAVRRGATPVTIDGLLDEEDYGRAAPVTFMDGEGVSDNTAVVRALWDDLFLYVAYRVTDAQLEVLGDGIPWNDDGIELYVDTAHDRSTVERADDFHVVIAIDGNVSVQSGTGDDLTATVPVLEEGADTPDGYTLEARIPWAGFTSTPTGGRTMGLLLANNDRDMGEARQFDWGGVRPFDQPDLWGTLELEPGVAEPDAGLPGLVDGGGRADAGGPGDAGSAEPSLMARGSGALCAVGGGGTGGVSTTILAALLFGIGGWRLRLR